MDTAVNLSPAQAEQKIYSYLRTNYALPDITAKIITAQSGHETAGWTSNVYKKFNNCFGYGYTGSGNYYSYPAITDSVDDLVGWLGRHVPDFANLDPDQYAQALKDNGYYTDQESNYAQGIWNYLNDNLQIAAGIGAAGLVLLVLVGFLLFKK